MKVHYHHLSLLSSMLGGMVVVGTLVSTKNSGLNHPDLDQASNMVVGWLTAFSLLSYGIICGILSFREQNNKFWRYSGIACASLVSGTWLAWAIF